MELSATDLGKEWSSGKFRPVYYLFGEEETRKREAVQRFKELLKLDDFNFRDFSGDPEAEAEMIVSEALTLPVFSERRLVLVSNPKLGAKARKALAAYLKEPLASTILVLLSSDRKPEPKDELAKAAAKAGVVCVFAPLSADQARNRLAAEAQKAGKKLSEEAAHVLIAEVGVDWGMLRQELEKVLLYAREAAEITAEDALLCLGYRKAADPFALTRLIHKRQLPEALGHLRTVFREGKGDDQAFRALAQISQAVAKEFKAKRMAAAGLSQEEIFRSLRLHSYWDREFMAWVGRLPDRKLLADYELCLTTETNLKSKTWLDTPLEVERLVASLCA